ncbi:hypothetical protein WH95_07910 [Kiloniella litopenaei]|uniref:FMN dependent NADH:quinone oxidoreductase n=1 Tax=Kiloniella litopenaei TaxID=1549748 RepID=A0A0M2RAZ1_9PROT|nr:NAD(P)H-dependent oxidoreductase [Kiloniella litopenaei]KKJ77589.1 hypothetical protein WH95_07910 [Kiloniella litopenaei]
MSTILHLDSSARRTDNSESSYNSISKKLAAGFIGEWKMRRQNDTVIYRDLSQTPPDFINQDWIAAVFTDEENRTKSQQKLLAVSDTLIDEVDKADIILISSPMYNYGMPAVLKAWFDQVIRIHKTFTFDLARGDYPLEPIMSEKTLVLITSTGEFGFEPGGIREKINHLGPHMKVMSKYLGVDNFYEIRSEYQEFGDDRHKQSITNAKTEIVKLVNELTHPAHA